MKKGRITLIAGVILLAALALIAKLYFVQIVNGSEFTEKADRQHQKVAGNVFDRGNIYFTQKDGTKISAATLKTGYTLALNPKILPKTEAGVGAPGSAGAVLGLDEIYQKISLILPDIDKADFIAKATKQNDTYEELKKKVSEEDGEKLSALKITGVNLYKEKWRYYPGNSLASHTLGFLGYKGDELAGRYGLEKLFDSTLDRSDSNVYANFFVEIFSNFKKAVAPGEQMEGDLVITIEPKTQAYLENALQKITETYSSEQAGGIILNPQTGEIYAMALYPTYNPNNIKDVKDPALFRNDLVESVYEMGSIIKPLTFSAGVDLGKIMGDTIYDDKGSVTADKKTIYNFDKKGRGRIPLETALIKSLNTGFAFITSQIGNQALTDYFLKFGLGEKSGVDLPNDATPLIDNLVKSPRDIEHITASFGQGIAMTPMTVIKAFTAIANGGELVRPFVVKRVEYKIGGFKNTEVQRGPRVIKEDAALEVTRILVKNLDTSLLNGRGKNPNYSIAAKTGTAQIASKNGGYYEDRNLHSFIGYLPAYNPQFLVFMYTVNPKGVRFSSETLAQPFVDMSKFLISYYQIAPDRGEVEPGATGAVGSSNADAKVGSSTPRVAPKVAPKVDSKVAPKVAPKKAN